MSLFNPAHLALFNLFICSIGLLGLTIFHLLYPKRKFNLFALLILISVVPVVSIFRSGTYESGLLTENVQIFISFFNTLRDGNLFPVWTQVGNAFYGTPLHLFMYPLPFYTATIFHYLGLGFLESIKTVLALSFVLSGATMYLYIKNKLGEVPAFVASLLYLFAPYHLIELHFRTTTGVTMAFIFMPLVLLYVDKLITNQKIRYVLLGGFFYGLLFLSHPATFTVFNIFLIPYVLFGIRHFLKNIKLIIYSLLLGIYGLMISAFYWVPLVYEAPLIKHVSLLHTSDFKSWWEYLVSPTLFGLLFQGHHGETHFLIGYPHLMLIAVLVVFIFLKKTRSKVPKETLFFIFMFFVLCIFLFPISKNVWGLPFLRDVPEAWRMLASICVVTSIIGAYTTKSVLSIYDKKYFIFQKRKLSIPFAAISLACLFIFFSTILNWGNRKMVPLNYKVIQDNFAALPATSDNRTWPIWVPDNAKWKAEPPTKHLQIINGAGQISESFRNSTKHTYLVSINQASTFRENTLYFPGWHLMVDNKTYPFSYTSKPYEGLVIFSLPKGVYKISLILENSDVREKANRVTFAALVVLTIYAGIQTLKYLRRKYA